MWWTEKQPVHMALLVTATILFFQSFSPPRLRRPSLPNLFSLKLSQCFFIIIIAPLCSISNTEHGADVFRELFAMILRSFLCASICHAHKSVCWRDFLLGWPTSCLSIWNIIYHFVTHHLVLRQHYMTFMPTANFSIFLFICFTCKHVKQCSPLWTSFHYAISLFIATFFLSSNQLKGELPFLLHDSLVLCFCFYF